MLHYSLTDENSSTSTEDSEENSLLEATRREYTKYQNEKKQFKIGKKILADEKKINSPIGMIDVIRLNVGGETIMTTRDLLTVEPRSVLAKLFNGRWEEKMSHDMDTNIFLDFNPVLFRHLLEQLRQFKRNPSSHFTSPHSSSLFIRQSFNRMLKKLGLYPDQSSQNEMIMMNVGGNRILARRKTFDSSKSTSLILEPSKRRIANDVMVNRVFVDTDPWLFRHLLGQLRERKTISHLSFRAPSSETMESMKRMLKALGLNRRLKTKFDNLMKDFH